MRQVIWHDLECGRYLADLPLWRELADAEEGPILDIGAGTGRVTLELARAGHHVVALDREADFVAELSRRAASLPVEAVVGDAGGFSLRDRRFGLIIAPMQTVQLLSARARAGFWRCARQHLTEHGLVACALADGMEAFDATTVLLPLADCTIVDGVSYYSQPIAMRDLGDTMAIKRVRTVITPDRERRDSGDVILLHKVDATRLEREAVAAGLRPFGLRVIPPTEEHVGTTVVMLRG